MLGHDEEVFEADQHRVLRALARCREREAERAAGLAVTLDQYPRTWGILAGIRAIV